MRDDDELIEYVGGPADGLKDTACSGTAVRFQGGRIYGRTPRKTAEGRTVFEHGCVWVVSVGDGPGKAK